MLLAHPVVLMNLLEQYEALKVLRAQNGDPGAQRRLDDVSYTLCVATGTRDIDMALIAARQRLSGARPTDDSLVES
ncbi:DUF5133 domain-containing protein [Streptomyces sp. T-3]|nr:DUF5133 domain-containing protein [Streptomyces sp. T-3]